jgi:hypothetical protein
MCRNFPRDRRGEEMTGQDYRTLEVRVTGSDRARTRDTKAVALPAPDLNESSYEVPGLRSPA